MTHSKHITIGLIIIIVGLSIYAIASGRGSFKKIRALTDEIEVTVDSLHTVQKRYDSLFTAYGNIQDQLENSIENLNNFKHDLDSIHSIRAQTINELNSNIENIIQKQDSIQRIDSLNNNFRFN